MKQDIASNLAVIQKNLTTQLCDLVNAVRKIHETPTAPPLDLTPIDMSIAQLESNHLALLALAKDAAGIDDMPAPEPLISTAPSSSHPLPE